MTGFPLACACGNSACPPVAGGQITNRRPNLKRVFRLRSAHFVSPVPTLRHKQEGAHSQRATLMPSSSIRERRGVTCQAAGAVPLEAGGAAESPASQPTSFVASIRGFLFYLCTFVLALPLFLVMVVQAPFVYALDKHRRLAQHFVSNTWAKVSTALFYRVQVEGREYLPAPEEPAVYVANHQSFLDIYTLFHLNRPFKFISKTSNFLIPIVGWSMFLTGHVRLNRVDRRSQIKCLSTCRDLLQHGASVLFFPEGTRSTDMRIQEFKKGAFSVAAKAGVPIVPVTLIGTGSKMPNKQESKLFPGEVRMIVHPRVAPSTADQMLAEARKAICCSLPQSLIPATSS